MIRLKVLLNTTKPTFSLSPTVSRPRGYCYACGRSATWQPAKIISDELSETWMLSPELRQNFDDRESMYCPSCGASTRLRQLAECIVHIYGRKSLEELVHDDNILDMQIAEINSCGKLHMILEKLPKLHYSEYGSKNKAIRSENLEMLSYKDQSLDLILTSDTLEHVPDFPKALHEIKRVLKPGGRHIFTVPVIWERKSKYRRGEKKSYHGAGEPDYLVYNEFGHDIIDVIKDCGFEVKIYKLNIVNLQDVAGVIIATRPKDLNNVK